MVQRKRERETCYLCRKRTNVVVRKSERKDGAEDGRKEKRRKIGNKEKSRR